MRSSTASRMMGIFSRCFFLACTLLVALCGGAQSPANRPSAAKSEEILGQSAADVDVISVHNVLAQPSGDNSSVSLNDIDRTQADSDSLPRSAINRLIVELVDEMPTGGGYRASNEAVQELEDAIQTEGDHLVINAALAKPSFCSSATYLVFVSALEELNRRGQIHFGPGVAEKFKVSGQHDGVGVWGRWNANGPGTARLFEELNLGPSFTPIEQAQAGDFLKIFWNDQIGAKEFGHSVVYLGHGLNSEGVEVVRYWSSNKKGGYGRAAVPRLKIKRMLFSRLENPERINRIGDGLKPDPYLASMLIRSSTPEEMKRMVGIPLSAIPDPIPAASVGKRIKGE